MERCCVILHYGVEDGGMAVSWRTKMALWFTHPYWLVTVSASGALMAIEYALLDKVAGREMRVSMMFALFIGLPTILYTKQLVRKHMEFYAEYSFVIGDQGVYRAFWRKNWKNLYANLPITAAVAATWVLSRLLHVNWAPMLGLMLILCILLYPEQEEIHRRIRERIRSDVKASG
jgi:hypothetical protein